MKPLLLVVLVAVAVAMAATGAVMVGRHVQGDSAGALPAGGGVLRDASGLLDLALVDLNGKPASAAAWRGRIIVLNFWATWCAPCREEMPDFDAQQKIRAGSGVQFVGVALDAPERVMAFLREVPVSYPILIADGRVLQAMSAHGNRGLGLPFTVIIDREGRVAATRQGKFALADLRSSLDRLPP